MKSELSDKEKYFFQNLSSHYNHTLTQGFWLWKLEYSGKKTSFTFPASKWNAAVDRSSTSLKDHILYFYNGGITQVVFTGGVSILKKFWNSIMFELFQIGNLSKIFILFNNDVSITGYFSGKVNFVQNSMSKFSIAKFVKSREKLTTYKMLGRSVHKCV